MTLFALPNRQCRFEIPEEWWAEAGMTNFAPTSASYFSAPDPCVIAVNLCDISCPRRTIANDFGGFNRSRLHKILSGFVAGEQIPPVKIQEMPQGFFRYELRDGFHRFYASIAAGFKSIPAVIATYLPA
jgi:hypothetical protein